MVLALFRLAVPLSFLAAFFLLPTVRAAASLSSAESFLLTNRETSRASLLEFLRFPSISALPSHQPDILSAADWLVKRLSAAGLSNARAISTRPSSAANTTDHFYPPVVYGEYLSAPPGAPTLLIYGHYDVQPADPLDLWTSPPFEPRIAGDNIYARGASDDKGHMYVPIAALEAWIAAGGPPVNVKFLLEGEEEVGSPHLPAFLAENRDLFAADYVVSADGGQVGVDQPGICTGLRGAAALQLNVYAAEADSHSGTFGGGIPNPIHALSGMLAKVHGEDGGIAVPGFYDDVLALSEEERNDFAVYEEIRPAEELLGTIKAGAQYGEKGFSFYERTWGRPSVEVVGIWGGFSGDGVKTVLPAEAHAKISSRIVAGQTSVGVGRRLKAFFEGLAAEMPGIRLEVADLAFEAEPFVMGKGGVANRAAAAVLTELYGKEPVYFRMGGSIPLTGIVKEVLGIETVMFAFGHNDENIHAPDEFARISSFDRGEKAYVKFLEVLATEHEMESAERGPDGGDGQCSIDRCASSCGTGDEL